MIDEKKLNATISWLIAGAQPAKTIDDITAECADRLNSIGVPIDVLIVNGLFIHPEIGGMQVRWSKRHGVRRESFDHDFFLTNAFTDSEVAISINTRRTQRLRLEIDPGATAKPYGSAFQNAGYTDLIVMPLFNFDGTVNGCVELGTTAKGGFSDDAVKVLRRMQSPIARMKEYFTERFDKQITLATYVGEETSRKVLSGNIVLGGGETISAVILFADIVGFTEISNNSDSKDVLRVLNTFFAAIDEAVSKNNGEILKFMGDGALVIFQTPDDLTAQEAAASSSIDAVASAREKLEKSDSTPAIEFRAALHVGDVFFGNIGSKSRLDFTAIGPAVNLASRMLAEASALGARTVCSVEFHDLAAGLNGQSVECQFKGFDQSETVFILE